MMIAFLESDPLEKAVCVKCKQRLSKQMFKRNFGSSSAKGHSIIRTAHTNLSFSRVEHLIEIYWEIL